MNHTLDIINGIPYYTNNTDQLFSWYSIYDDGVIITELNNYSSVDFNSIPKSDIKYFGLYGCGFHLNCNMNNGEVSIYQSYKENELCYSVQPSLTKDGIILSNTINRFDMTSIVPFTFKHFVLETDFNDKTSSRCFIDEYYAGYTGILTLEDNIQILFKLYFSIHQYEFPNSIGIIYKFFPYKQTEYRNTRYRFELAENVCYDINGNQKTTKNNICNIINFNATKGYYKNKLIFSYR